MEKRKAAMPEAVRTRRVDATTRFLDRLVAAKREHGSENAEAWAAKVQDRKDNLSK